MNRFPALEVAVFIGGIWAATKSMLDASAFVNDLRDTVVIGIKDGHALSLPHRKVLRSDWLLTMSGAVGFLLVFSTLLFVIASRLGRDVESAVRVVLFVIAFVPFLGSLLFVLCGIGDWRLMADALRMARKGKEPQRAGSK